MFKKAEPTKVETSLARIETIAARYEISPRYVRELIQEGVLPVVRLGKKCVRVHVGEADAAMRRLMTGGPR